MATTCAITLCFLVALFFKGNAEIPEQCYLSADPGRCLAYMPMYFYNYVTGKCTRFIYGGCEGNDNRFATLEECLATCKVVPPVAFATEKICSIPGQVFSTCAPGCNSTCTNPTPSCSLECTQRCSCPHELLLDEQNNRCVKMCPKIPCEIPGQVFQACASACDRTCADPNPTCTTQCARRCACPPGMFLDENQRRCVKVCPRPASVLEQEREHPQEEIM